MQQYEAHISSLRNALYALFPSVGIVIIVSLQMCFSSGGHFHCTLLFFTYFEKANAPCRETLCSVLTFLFLTSTMGTLLIEF